VTRTDRILAALADGPKTYQYLSSLFPGTNAQSAIKQLELYRCIRRVWHDQGDTKPLRGKRHIFAFELTGRAYKPQGKRNENLQQVRCVKTQRRLQESRPNS
jgi:hypothetical protein